MTTITQARDSYHLLVTQFVHRPDRCSLNLGCERRECRSTVKSILNLGGEAGVTALAPVDARGEETCNRRSSLAASSASK